MNPPSPPSDPKAAPPDLNFPVFMGAINLPDMPQPKRKRRWGWLLAWSLLMFAGGVAAGPILIDQAFALVERVAPMVGISVPRFVEKRRPADRVIAPTPMAAPEPESAPAPAPAPEPEPAPAAPQAPAGEGRVEAIAAKPIAIPAEIEPEPAQPAAAPAPHDRVAAKRPVATAPARTEVATAAEPPVARPLRGKGAAKTAAAAGTPTRKASDYEDPFAADDEGSAKTTTASAKSRPAAKSEPAPGPAAAKTHDSLDSLMTDGVGDNKGKKRESKDLDALLKDVQKSKPEPAPKREAPPPASALSPSDISRVMAGVKTRGNACAQRIGQTGIAELKITVGKNGAVTDVVVGGKIANTPLAACIEKATRAATFPVSTGLRFDYRIDAR